MAKWFGQIGFAEEVELRPGVIKETVVPHDYYGEVIRLINRNQGANQVIDNVRIDNQISIIADTYAIENFGRMKWIIFGGTKWKISSIEVKRPRLILSMGDLWNENTA